MIEVSMDLVPLQAALAQADQKLRVLVANFVETAGRSVVQEGRAFVRPARGVNVQDNPRGTYLRPARGRWQVRSFGDETIVELFPYWTYSRSKALQAIMARHGGAAELRRAGLWVRPRRLPGQVPVSLPKSGKAYVSRAGLVYVPMAGHLATWAARRDRGAHMWRQAIRVAGPVLADLALAPAVARALPRLERVIQEASR